MVQVENHDWKIDGILPAKHIPANECELQGRVDEDTFTDYTLLLSHHASTRSMLEKEFARRNRSMPEAMPEAAR